MPTKSTRKPQKKRPAKDPEQHARFVETAIKLGADRDEGALDRGLKKVAQAAKK
jgi:hypothetical protein